MTVPTVVAIPTRDRMDLLVPLVTELTLQDQHTELWILDNSDAQNVRDHLVLDKKLHVRPCPDMGIYPMWNMAWDLAVKHYPSRVNVALLNDDIRIPENFIGTLASALRYDKEEWWCVYPNYHRTLADPVTDEGITATEGTYKHDGMSGWAFMFRGEIMYHGVPFVDENFVWWCGDDDFARQVVKHGGKIGRVNGLPVEHPHESTVQNYPHLQAAKASDIRYLIKKHGKEAW